MLAEYERRKLDLAFTSTAVESRKEVNSLISIKKDCIFGIFRHFQALSALCIGDGLGMSLLFVADETNVMIYLASSSFLYQIQTFAVIVLIKALFILRL